MCLPFFALHDACIPICPEWRVTIITSLFDKLVVECILCLLPTEVVILVEKQIYIASVSSGISTPSHQWQTDNVVDAAALKTQLIPILVTFTNLSRCPAKRSHVAHAKVNSNPLLNPCWACYMIITR